MLLPLPTGQLFQVRGSKLKLHPVCHLSWASVLCITHSVFFFGVRKDAFNGLFTLLVKILALRCIAGVVRQVLVILPDMPLYTSLRSPWNVCKALWWDNLRKSLDRSPFGTVKSYAQIRVCFKTHNNRTYASKMRIQARWIKPKPKYLLASLS